MQKRTFTDAEGREYTVRFGFKQIVDVRTRLDFDLAKLLADDMRRLKELTEDVVLMINVLYVMVGDQHQLTAEEFGEAMRGDALQEGSQALFDAFVDFCPSQQRKMLRAMLAAGNSLQQKTEGLMEEVSAIVQTASLSEMTSGELDSRLRQLLASKTGSSTACENLTGQLAKG